jgi:hypothetical protein
MDDLGDIALKVYEVVFGGKISVQIKDEEYSIRRTRTGLRFVEIGEHVFLEQNPEKDSRWGELARQGHKILWVLEGRKYVAQVRDGKYYALRSSSRAEA